MKNIIKKISYVLVALFAIVTVQTNAKIFDTNGTGFKKVGSGIKTGAEKTYGWVKKHPGSTVGLAIGGALLTDSALGKLREKRQQEAGAGQYSIDVGKRYGTMSNSEQKAFRKKSIELYQKGKSYKRRLAGKLGIMSY